ncbi:conserved exported hypothetical protein [uncultured Eubacteriales bacterium]|uniref:DUF4179 domain-containing protein n=1 Tax=uncultured Eubacteriales bacterium TaxID=172733 RepID=A0A212J274_9FIRM|nr:conserved exported hypothetical protein [uncultured Eubacteriales bacterium]
MDRMQEFNSIFNEPVPPALEQSVQRARARHKAARRGKVFGIPLASLAGAAAAFVLLVNLSTPFALAASRVPFLRELTAAVALSPSLKAAVEHDYVQYVGQRQTVNGVTMTVEYLIVDQRQVNVFYTLKSDQYPALEGDPTFTTTDGAQVQASIQWGYFSEGEALRKITLDFPDSVPDTLLMTYQAYPSPYGGEDGEAPATSRATDEERPPKPETVAEFAFTLRFDPAFTQPGQVYELDYPVILDGQTITVKTVEIYPTHIQLNLRDDAANTAWLKGLNFYLEDEKGTRYEKISNGITATGDPGGTPFMPSHRLESSYFGDAKHLTIHITGVEWLDKGKEYIDLDIAKGIAENLPQGVTLGKAERLEDDVDVVLVVQGRDEGSYGVLYDGWLDAEGGHHDVNRRVSSNASEEEREWDGVTIPSGSFYEAFTLENCPWDQVKLSVSFSRYGTFDAPIEVPVK